MTRPSCVVRIEGAVFLPGDGAGPGEMTIRLGDALRAAGITYDRMTVHGGDDAHRAPHPADGATGPAIYRLMQAGTQLPNTTPTTGA